jgi:hypothetical protein
MWIRNWKLEGGNWKLETRLGLLRLVHTLRRRISGVTSASPQTLLSAPANFFTTSALAVFLLLLVAAGASATTLVLMSLEQLSQAASDVVRGRVVSQEMRWNESNTQIVTLTTISVSQRIKGRAQAAVVVEQPGGTVGNIRSRVAGTVHFQQDGDYVLFLEPSKIFPSRRLVVGMMQGAYRVYRDVTTNEERVIQPFSKHAEREQADAVESAERGAAPAGAETVPLSQFNQQLSSAIAAPLVVPKGTSIPLVIETTEFEGVGRMHLVGRTTADLFPDSRTVIPAGSYIEGSAQKWQDVWKIYWTGLSVRGASIPISASSEEFSESLRGRSMMVRVK